MRLAERQYDAVDPENRLVARALEKRWNEALEALGHLEREYAVAQKTILVPLTQEEQEAVRQLSLNVPAIWEAETTTMADRKRLVRTVIQEVTLTPTAPRQATMTILWSGNVTTRHEIICPPIGWHCLAPPALVERLRELASRLPDHQIAELLNAEEVRTPTGTSWTAGRVACLRKQHAIVTACPIEPGAVSVRGDGLISTTETARRLQVSRSLVNVWLTHGVLIGDQRAADRSLGALRRSRRRPVSADRCLVPISFPSIPDCGGISVRLRKSGSMCAEASICPIVGALGDASNGVFAHRIVPARSHQVR